MEKNREMECGDGMSVNCRRKARYISESSYQDDSSGTFG